MGYEDEFIEGEGLVPLVTKSGRHGSYESITFYAPPITERFSSPMVNAANFAYSTDDAWTVRRVAKGRKPLAFTCGYHSAWIRIVEAAGGEVDVITTVYGKLLAATLGGRVSERFDLDALMDDYSDYLIGAPHAVLKSIEVELNRIGTKNLRDFLKFRDVEVGPKRTPAELARCGLLLGYPIASTAACIRVGLGMSGGHTCVRREG